MFHPPDQHVHAVNRYERAACTKLKKENHGGQHYEDESGTWRAIGTI